MNTGRRDMVRLIDSDKLLTELMDSDLDHLQRDDWKEVISVLGDTEKLKSARPEFKYTKKELDVFRHGISLSLLSKRSSQHWRYDEDTAKEIEFLEKLYKKVVADMKGEQGETG